MATKRKSDDPEKTGTKSVSEKQLHAAARAAIKKADRLWRLAEKAPSGSYREQHMSQARAASELAADKTRQAYEIRTKAHEKAE
jgi:hypothetical protein